MDPQLVDPASARNFHLESGSPAIGKGTSAASVISSADYEGNPRVVFDIGAYQFQSGTVSAAPAAPRGFSLK